LTPDQLRYREELEQLRKQELMQNRMRNRAHAHHRSRASQGQMHKISSRSHQASHLLDESKEAEREWEREFAEYKHL
jgi:hypothetical protein